MAGDGSEALVIYDLDGCLVDSELMSLSAIRDEVAALGLGTIALHELRDRYLGVKLEDLVADIERRFATHLPGDFIDRYYARLYAAYEVGLGPIVTMVAALDRLLADGLRACIATGGGLDRMHRTLGIAGLDARFAGRAFSADEVAHGKPAPDLFLFCAERLAVPVGRCVVVEDSPHGIVGAVAAGMRALGFTGGTHLDGVRDRQEEKLRAAGAWRVHDDAESLETSIREGLGLVA